MTEGLRAAAERLGEAGARLAEVGSRLCDHDPGAAPFGAGGAGRLGAVGRALHGHWRDAVDAGARQAAAHSARLLATGEALRLAADNYAGADQAVRRRHEGGP